MDPTPELRATVQRLRRNRFLLALALVVLPVGPTLLQLATTLQPSTALAGLLAVLGTLVTFASPFFALGVVLASPRPARAPVALRAGPDGLALDGRLVAPRARIRAGFVIPDRLGVLVRIERRFQRALHLVVRDPEQGRAVLRALGLDASQTVAAFRLRSLAQADGRRQIGILSVVGLILGAPVLAAVFRSALLGGVLALGCFLTFCVWMVMIAVPARVTVGADGVLVSWFWRERFIPYADILHVTPSYVGVPHVALGLQSGRVLRLPTRGGWTHDQQRQATLALSQRILEALGDARGGGLAQDAARLARGERHVSAWIKHLRALGAGADADHRHAPIPADRLWRLVEDATAAPDTRAAAAVALAGDPEARARLRVLASATAAPRLRVALEAAADAEAEAEVDAEAHEGAPLARALAALAPAAPAPAAKAAPPSTPASPSAS